MSNLNTRLLAAYAAGDKAALVRLYAEAADGSAIPDEAGFFRTQAYIFALETGHADASSLHTQLIKDGREA